MADDEVVDGLLGHGHVFHPVDQDRRGFAQHLKFGQIERAAVSTDFVFPGGYHLFPKECGFQYLMD